MLLQQTRTSLQAGVVVFRQESPSQLMAARSMMSCLQVGVEVGDTSIVPASTAG